VSADDVERPGESAAAPAGPPARAGKVPAGTATQTPPPATKPAPEDETPTPGASPAPGAGGV